MVLTSVFGADEDLELARRGISFHAQALSEGFTLAYYTSEADYSGTGKNVAQARLFLVSENGDAAHAQAFLKKRFPGDSETLAKIDKVARVNNDSVLARKEVAQKFAFEISALFPAAVRRDLGREGRVAQGGSVCSNCMGSARAFHTGESVAHIDTPEFKEYVAQLKPVANTTPPNFGEVLFFPKSEHAAIYLFDGLVYQKPTWGIYHTYEIVPYEQMHDTINRAITHFSGGAPASSFTRSAWDIFLSTLEGAKPIGGPPAISDAEAVKRFTAVGCPELLTGK